ncbi:glycosyltransferase family 4 protein [Rhodobacteraceae bacterium NNCM2]|nr:glycosyltransferase family 4 protein [Coraliihabitans acroporae]
MVTHDAIKVGILTAKDASNPRVWSGTHYYLSQSAQRHIGPVTYFGPIRSNLLYALKARERISRYVFGRRELPSHSMAISRQYGRILKQQAQEIDVDVALAPAGGGLIANLEIDQPIVYTSDATFDLVVDYYPEFSGITRAARHQGHAIEQAAIDRADIIVYPTQWAADSAMQVYGADPAKTFVAAYGPNFDTLPDRAEALAPRDPSNLRLVFVGVRWEIKGGPIAVEAFRTLKRMGVPTELTIIGCDPGIQEEGLTIIPFLDKNDPEQAARLSEIYLESDLLIVPTRAECYGIVFCEAAAHGVPSITTATGGTVDVVRQGIGGYGLNHAEKGEGYAEVIRDLYNDKDRLESLRQTSRDEYENRLNWDIWGKRTRALIEERLGTRLGLSSA